jgi:hypothetical protein
MISQGKENYQTVKNAHNNTIVQPLLISPIFAHKDPFVQLVQVNLQNALKEHSEMELVYI